MSPFDDCLAVKLIFIKLLDFVEAAASRVNLMSFCGKMPLAVMQRPLSDTVGAVFLYLLARETKSVS